jgi:hypothetical protein
MAFSGGNAVYRTGRPGRRAISPRSSSRCMIVPNVSLSIVVALSSSSGVRGVPSISAR